jgi:glutamate-1-semialdehyde 2,1-aminomutase
LRGDEIAAVIVEPIAGNMGVVAPEVGFLRTLRDLTRESRSLLIFDEVITGFRVARGGAQAALGVTPDLTTLGKIIGGGLPVGAYGGRRDVMERVAPVGPVYQAGTLSGNPLATAAGRATLEHLTPETYEQLRTLTARLAEGLRSAADHHGVPVQVNHVTGMLTMFFTGEAVTSLAGAQTADTAAYARFFHAMLDRGVSLPPSQFEAWMLSTAHSDDDIDAVIRAAFESLGATE